MTEPYVSWKYVDNPELVNEFSPVVGFLLLIMGMKLGRLIVVKGMLTC